MGSYLPQLVQAVALPSNAEASRRARDLVERGEHYLRQAISSETNAGPPLAFLLPLGGGGRRKAAALGAV